MCQVLAFLEGQKGLTQGLDPPPIERRNNVFERPLKLNINTKNCQTFYQHINSCLKDFFRMLKNYLPQALKLVAKDKKASLRVKKNQEWHIKANQDGQLYTKL